LCIHSINSNEQNQVLIKLKGNCENPIRIYAVLKQVHVYEKTVTQHESANIK